MGNPDVIKLTNQPECERFYSDMSNSSENIFSTGYVLNEKWVIIELVGKGAMGEVYRAHQLNLKRDVAIKVISQEMLQSLFRRSAEWHCWHALYERIHGGEMNNAWDYQLILSSFRHSQCCIIPSVNLVSNIGFGPDGTHVKDEASLMHNFPKGEIKFPLVHPVDVRRSHSVDYAIFRIRILCPPTLWVRAVRLLLRSKLIRILNRARKKIKLTS